MKEGSCKIILKIIKPLISFLYFTHECEFNNILHEDHINSCTKLRRNLHLTLHYQRRTSR